MLVCAITGPVLVCCSQHWPSIDPVLTHNGMFTGVFFLLRGADNTQTSTYRFRIKMHKTYDYDSHRLSKLSRLIFLVAYSTGWPSKGYSISYLSVCVELMVGGGGYDMK